MKTFRPTIFSLIPRLVLWYVKKAHRFVARKIEMKISDDEIVRHKYADIKAWLKREQKARGWDFIANTFSEIVDENLAFRKKYGKLKGMKDV